MHLTFFKMEVFHKHLHFWFLLKCGLSDNTGVCIVAKQRSADVGGCGPLLMEPVFWPQSSYRSTP